MAVTVNAIPYDVYMKDDKHHVANNLPKLWAAYKADTSFTIIRHPDDKGDLKIAVNVTFNKKPFKSDQVNVPMPMVLVRNIQTIKNKTSAVPSAEPCADSNINRGPPQTIAANDADIAYFTNPRVYFELRSPTAVGNSKVELATPDARTVMVTAICQTAGNGTQAQVSGYAQADEQLVSFQPAQTPPALF